MKENLYRTISVVALVAVVFIAMFANNVKFHAGNADADALAGAAYMRICNGMATEEQVANDLITIYKEGNTNAAGAVDILVNKLGVCTQYKEQFNAAGMNIGGSANANQTEAAPTPQTKTEFTVTDLEPYSAWATQDCNIRSGADTTYDKAGSLKKYEEVTVTGKASTGWFRITTASGIEAYISDSLLTTENPSNREYTTVNDEGEILTYEFTDTKPEVIDEIIENIENTEEEHEHSYTSEVTTQPTCTAPGVTTYTCECGDTYTEEITALGHTEGEWEVTKNATMLSDGEKVKKCSVCGEVLETEVIPANKTMLYAIITGIIGALAIIGVILGIVIKRKK